MSEIGESVGVGGTGASNWSEPTKSSSMQFKNFIPEAKEGEYEPAHGGIEHPLPREEIEDPIESLFDDPIYLTLSAIEPTGVEERRPRGRPLGRRTDPGAKERLAHPELEIEPASAKEVEEIEATYARAREEMGILSQAPSSPEEWARQQERMAVYAGEVSPQEASVLMGKVSRAQKRRGEVGGPPLSPEEWSKLHRFWSQELERPAAEGPTIHRPDVATWAASTDPELEDIAGMRGGLYPYRSLEDAKRLQPEAYRKLVDIGEDPGDGIFVMLNREFKRPSPPTTLSRSDPKYDSRAANIYNGRMLLYRLSRNVPPGSRGRLFWSSLRDWNRHEIEEGDDYMWDPETTEWSPASAEDIERGEVEPSPAAAPEKGTVDWWNIEYDPRGEGFYVPEEERAHVDYPEVGALDPEELRQYDVPDVPDVTGEPEDLEDWERVDYPGGPRYVHKQTGELYGYQPGASTWQRKMLAKKPEYFHTSDIGKFDDPEELRKMKLNEFFVVDEAARKVKHTWQKYYRALEDDPDVRDPKALAAYLKRKEKGIDEAAPGGDPGFTDDKQQAEVGFPGNSGFEDPTSSRMNAGHDDLPGAVGGRNDLPGAVSGHDDLPGAEGGQVNAPPGVFQDEKGRMDGFGPLDMVDADDRTGEHPPAKPGGPTDDAADRIDDPGFNQKMTGDDPFAGGMARNRVKNRR